MKYAYAAIFKEEVTGFSVRFPDIEGCFTSGETLQDAILMAEDALCLMLYDLEENNKPIPQATDIRNIQTANDERTSYVVCDTLEYRKLFDTKAVKKTLTIPSWLNTLAEKNDINFSAVLQNALKQTLDV